MKGEWQRFLLSNKQLKRESKRVEMIIKMVTEFKLTVVHFARPNDADLCMREDLPLDQSCGKSGLGHRAAGPSRAAGLLLAKPHSYGVLVNRPFPSSLVPLF